MDLAIDFSWSISDWLAVFKRLFELVAGFFADLGIKLFKDSAPAETPDADSGKTEDEGE